MMLACRAVVGPGGFDFIAEFPYPQSASVDAYPNMPLLHALVPIYPLVFRTAFSSVFPTVTHILGMGRRSEIGLPVVQTVAVNMIDEHIVGDFEHFAVHLKLKSFAVSIDDSADCVEGIAATLDGVPFVSGKVRIIVRVHYRVLPLTQRHPVERIPVSNQAIQEHGLHEYPNKPERDGNGNTNATTPQL